MNQIVSYFAHDPISNFEKQIFDFNKEKLESEKERGIIFIARYMDGTRKVVPIEDVKEPNIVSYGGATIATPSYVDERVNAITNLLSDVVTTVSALDASKKASLISKLADIKSLAKVEIGNTKQNNSEDV